MRESIFWRIVWNVRVSQTARAVDGYFWHGCPIHSHLPKSHKEYWHPKLKRNMERDKAKNKRLEVNGWIVLRFWEHELKDADEVASKIENALKLL